jgi:hypothetical protein
MVVTGLCLLDECADDRVTMHALVKTVLLRLS